MDDGWYSKKRKYIPVNTVLDRSIMSDELRRNLLGFHALTGSDTTSYFCGISKKSAFKIFKANANLIEGHGYGQMSDELLKNCELFICKCTVKMLQMLIQLEMLCLADVLVLNICHRQVTPAHCTSKELIINLWCGTKQL